MKPTGKRIKSFLLRFSLLPLLLLGVGGYAPIVLAQSAGTFIPTGNMITHRHSHSATLLQNGKVLITGGWSNSTLLASAELFDPDTGTFSATGNMTTPHFNHSATLLPDGRVLIAGGRVLDDGHPLDHPPAAAELYDPSTGTFTPTGRMVRPQAGNTSTLLNNGKVLISGTCQDWFYTDADAEGDRPELYDPVTGTFNAAGQDGRSPRWCSGPVVLLANGKVLVATGELYDPATDTFSSTGPRKTIGFWGATATLLTNGKVLVAGGTSDLGDSTKGELYDPSTGNFTVVGNMVRPRAWPTATLLRDGTVLIAGENSSASSAELYDPATNKFVAAGDILAPIPSYSSTATLLMDGRVLIAGSTNTNSSSAQLYVPSVVPAQVDVSELSFDSSSVVAGHSYSASFSGINLTPQTFFDVRFTSPGGAASDVVLNWQVGVVASHDVPSATPSGIWTVTNVRAHQVETDHTGSFVPVSATLTVPSQVVVSDLSFDSPSVVAGSSYSASFSGINLAPQTFFDVRFTSPGSTASDVVLNWQVGTVASHEVPAGTPSGTWKITGVRAHQAETDHTDSFVPVSAAITVSP